MEESKWQPEALARGQPNQLCRVANHLRESPGVLLYNAFGVCRLSGFYSQGALRDPGLRNLTPSAYETLGEMP